LVLETNFAVGNLQLSLGKLQLPVPTFHFFNARRHWCKCCGFTTRQAWGVAENCDVGRWTVSLPPPMIGNNDMTEVHRAN